MATACIPDESYIPTYAINSGHTVKNVAVHYLKSFNGEDAYRLCRHLNDADFCGRGPDVIGETDWPALTGDGAHAHFFARKFQTDNVALLVRQRLLHWSYYWYIERHVAHVQLT